MWRPACNLQNMYMLESYKAGKLGGLKARNPSGFLASQPSSYELSATSYFAGHRERE
jgi:hypothetical protein